MAWKHRAWCSPLTNQIYYGSINSDTGKATKGKRNITEDAIRSVAENLLYQPRVVTFKLQSGKLLSLKSSVKEDGIGDSSVEDAAYDLLHALQRMTAQFHAAGVESHKESMNPSEELLFQAEQAIAKALGQQ